MADTTFHSTINSIIADLKTSIPTANADDLLKYARVIKNIRQTENDDLEQLLNTRLNSLLSGANDVATITKLSLVVSKVLDLVTPNTSSGAELPRQDGQAGEFLKTDGTDMSWSEIVKADIRGIDHSSLSKGEILVYNNSTNKFVGIANAPTNTKINSYTDYASFPANGKNSTFAIAQDTNKVYAYANGQWHEWGSI